MITTQISATVRQTAVRLIAAYGAQARYFAADKAAQMLRDGNLYERRTWRRIQETVELLLADDIPADADNPHLSEQDLSMIKKTDLLRAMANDKRRQAEVAWNPHTVRQCLELAKAYERRAEIEERMSAQPGYDEDGMITTEWPRIARHDRARAERASSLAR